MSDIKYNKQEWVYSEKVKDHFLKPRNMVQTPEPEFKFNGLGEVGSPACGDVMKFWIYVSPETLKIEKSGWKTFGCASAISSTSALSEMIEGTTIEKAKKITAKDIIDYLGGLPANKVHCSVLGDQALRLAITDFENNAK
ncbi:MAG: iron-sulfur cluster assembly scaffold protein [Patescibacteria group bacterium]|jgi:NifU-like protein involved in Fe-S cluster formation